MNRAVASPAFTGPLLADMGFEAAHNCHDTFFSHVVAVDFPQLDNARHASLYVGLPGPGSVHVGTRIVGAFLDCGKTATSVPPAAVVLTTGDFTIGSRTVTSVGTTAGIAVGDPINAGVLAPNTLVTGVSPTTIALSLPAASSGTTQTLTVSHGYQGIELAPLAKDVTVAATSTSPGCHMAPNQIVTQDGQADPSTQVVGSSYGIANAMAAAVMTDASSVTMVITDYHLCVSPPSGGTGVILPPTPALGVIYSVDDCGGSAGLNNIAVTPSAGNGTIDNMASYLISSNYGSWSGYYTGSNWKTTAHQ